MTYITGIKALLAHKYLFDRKSKEET